MPKPDVLARVKNDLDLGNTRTAIQRLRTLVAVDPNDLEVHRRLAEVYRQAGNTVEAGRWSFLTEDVRPEELAAFEYAHPDPWLRLRLIQWSGDPILLPGDGARARLSALKEEAEQSGPPERWERIERAAGQRATTVPCLFVAVTLAILCLLTVAGLFWALGPVLP